MIDGSLLGRLKAALPAQALLEGAELEGRTEDWLHRQPLRAPLVLRPASTAEVSAALSPGERVPWHLHPDSDDLFICLRGTFEIHEINPERKTVLKALERHLVPKRSPHMVVNASGEECQLLTVQPGNYDFRRLPKLDAR